MTRKVRVVLELEVEDWADPVKTWDWATLLDLEAPVESVRVVETDEEAV